MCNISIHALRVEGDAHKKIAAEMESISIHALREEGDVLLTFACPIRIISIHALREEGDPSSLAAIRACENFYPRPP